MRDVIVTEKLLAAVERQPRRRGCAKRDETDSARHENLYELAQTGMDHDDENLRI